MSPLTLIAIAVVTVGSRVAALAVLPQPQGLVAEIVCRLPAPLFAALAALSLVGGGGGIEPAMLAAVGCALLATRWSSLLVVLAAGLTGFAVTTLVW
jgi:hypothetical protein